MLAMAVFFALGAAMVREASETVDHSITVFFRYLIGIAFLLPVIHGDSRPTNQLLFQSQAWRWHIARGLFGFSAMYCYFYTLAHIPLAEAVLFIYASPVFVPLLAKVLLQETLNTKAIYSALLGLAGLLLLANPERTELSHAHFVGLLSTFFGALAFVSVRRLSITDPPIRTVFFFTAIGTLLSIAVSLGTDIKQFSGIPQLSLYDLTLLVGIGLVTTLAQWLMSKGYSYGPAAALAPFSYFTIVFGGLLGWLLWQEAPSLPFILGTTFVLAAAAVNFRPPTLK